MAQQILTATAKLRGQADPVLALSASCILASLAAPDAHPSYLASSAAAVLTSQLLQADQHDLPALMQAGRETPVGGGGSGADLPLALGRVLQLATEGQLGRQLAAELGPSSSTAATRGGRPAGVCRTPSSHLPMVLVAMVQATSTESSRIHFSDRIKHNLRKV